MRPNTADLAKAPATEAAVRERPILFSAPMVRALLAGTKTQTRRVMTPQPELAIMDAESAGTLRACQEVGLIPSDQGTPRWRWRGTFSMPWPQCMRSAPNYGARGDRLWVKESIAHMGDGRSEYADGTPTVADAWPWKRPKLPGMFCPRGLSRILLEVTGVRVEQLKDISKADAIAEGARSLLSTAAPYPDSAAKWSMEYPHPVEADAVRGHEHCLGSPQMAFANKWNAINGKREGCAWEDSPWVWVVAFERVEP